MKNSAYLEQGLLPFPPDIPVSGIFTQVYSNCETGICAYSAFCENAVYTGSQHPLWISSWLDGLSDNHCLIAIVWKDGGPAMALALDVRQYGPLSVAAFVGGTHANNNFPALTDQSLDFEDLLAALLDIRSARPDIDAIFLERQRLELDGRPNPLLKLRHIISPNLSLAMDLEASRRTNIMGSPRKMKRHRNTRRKLEAAGGARIFRASTHEEVDELFDRFLEWKEVRFAQQGVTNVFGPVEVQKRFRKLFHASLAEQEPSFILYGLEVGGILRAVNGYSRSHEGLLCDFLAYRNDELASVGPGEYLTYEVVVEACARGDAIYDFGVGDETYKRGWCDLERDQMDTLLGLTSRGKMFALFTTALALLKRSIKRNRFASALLRRLRRFRLRHDP